MQPRNCRCRSFKVDMSQAMVDHDDHRIAAAIRPSDRPPRLFRRFPFMKVLADSVSHSRRLHRRKIWICSEEPFREVLCLVRELGEHFP